MSAPATYWLVDDVVGWRSSLTGLSVVGADRDLRVDSLPGLAMDLAAALPSTISCPVALCESSCGEYCYVLDDLDSKIHALSLRQPRPAHVLRGVGGEGREPRRFLHARGIAAFSDGSLAVSDTGNHRVQIFSPFPYALTSVIEHGLRSPWGIAVARCNTLYIADRGNGCVLHVDREGRTLEKLEGFQAPTAIAIAADEMLAIVDGETLVVYAGDRNRKWQKAIPQLSSVTFDKDNYLYAGTHDGLVYKFAPDQTLLLREMGVGVLGRDGGVDALCWTRAAALIVAVSVPCLRPGLFHMTTDGSYADQGTLLTDGLDSGIEGCGWDRIQLDCKIPDGTSIVVETQTSLDDTWKSDRFAAPIVLSKSATDCLIQADPNQFCRMRLTFRTNGTSSPTLHLAKVFYPRESYLRYLPAVYQEDPESRDFLDRFLSIFQASFDSYDNWVDTMWQIFDPDTVPAQWFNWLAAWLALPIDPTWTDRKRRSVLKAASQTYARRGTPDGLAGLISDYAGVDASIVEHFKLRRLTILGRSNPPDDSTANPTSSTTSPNWVGSGLCLWSRDVYQRLQLQSYSRLGYFRLRGEPEPAIESLAWGANEFTVMFTAEPYTVATTLSAVTKVVEREKPANTLAHYQPVYARFRVGVQSSIGVDTRIGELTRIVLSKVATLGYDSMLSASTAAETLRTAGRSTPAQAGINSRLL